MLISIIMNMIISFVIIMTGHQIWIFLKNNHSVKQKMDLVGSQTYKYKNILHDIQKKEQSKEIPTTESTELVEYVSDYGDLKKDLEQYLQEIQ